MENFNENHQEKVERRPGEVIPNPDLAVQKEAIEWMDRHRQDILEGSLKFLKPILDLDILYPDTLEPSEEKDINILEPYLKLFCEQRGIDPDYIGYGSGVKTTTETPEPSLP